MTKNTYIPRDEIVDMHKEFNKVRKKVEKELLKIHGVLAVGVGLREKKGEIQRELCFKVTVEKKKAKSKLKVKERIPEEIYGFKTDVVEKTITLPAADSKKYRPLIGGCQIQSSTKSGVGTLGCFARRNSDNKIVLITNWHVVIDNATSTDNERIGQPSHNGCCSCCATGEFATVVGGFLNTTHDVAIALINGQETDTIPEERYINEILGIGIIAGSAEPMGGETVFKYGRTTGLTKGQILNDNTSIGVDFSTTYDGLGTINRMGVQITPVAPHPKFIDFGDSGSVTVNEHNQVVVLNWAIQGGGRISRVENDLGIQILDSSLHPNVAGKQGVRLSSVNVPNYELSLSGALSQLDEELAQYDEGKKILELFKVHREELLQLVRTNREVMAAWHRYKGPAYLSHITRRIRRGTPIPEQINGISLQNLILKMTAVLQRNGSDGLVDAVKANYLKILNVVASGNSIEDWKNNLADLELKSKMANTI